VKCIATTLLLGSVFFGSCGQLRAGTVAYWRFEDGTAGTEHAGDQDNWYQDISGNGNHLSSWWDQARPMATADRPFTTVPQTGAANNLALDFDRGAEGTDDLVTGPAVKMIDSYLFSGGWTIEASFKPRVARMGTPIPTTGSSRSASRSGPTTTNWNAGFSTTMAISTGSIPGNHWNLTNGTALRPPTTIRRSISISRPRETPTMCFKALWSCRLAPQWGSRQPTGPLAGVCGAVERPTFSMD